MTAYLGLFASAFLAATAGALLSDPNVDCVILVMTPQPHLAETVDAFVTRAATLIPCEAPDASAMLDG